MIKKLQSVICIPSIDRIKTSCSVASLKEFKWNFTGKMYSQFKSKKETHLIECFMKGEKRIQLITPINIDSKIYNQRYYVNLMQPNAETWRYVKELIQKFSRINMYKQFNPTINELEVAYDFFSNDDTDDVVYELHDFFHRHLYMKYSHKGSAISEGKHLITSYRARDEDGRGSDIESKCYMKELPFGNGIRTACRLEVLLNAKGVRDKKITFDDLSLNPRDYNVLTHFQLLDNISFQGITNISRSISRNKGVPFTRKAKASMKTAIRANILKEKIHGSWLEDNYLPVPEQIDRAKEEIMRYGLNINPKRYCQPLFDLTETVKRMLDDAEISQRRTGYHRR